MKRLFVAPLGALAACSALIDPDRGALGRLDAGSSDVVAPTADVPRTDGPRPDGARADARMGCGDCNDDVACTMDRCDMAMGVCVNAPDDERCPGSEVCLAGRGCVPPTCATDADCDDRTACTGEERCRPGDPSANMRGCVQGPPPNCDDGHACTVDRCDGVTDACASSPDDGRCNDGVDCTVDACDPSASSDGSGCAYRPDDGRCGGSFCAAAASCDRTMGCRAGGAPRDCSDGSACTTDRCDEAARMCVNTAVDADGDGRAAEAVGGTMCAGGTDCDDGDATIFPGADEHCNARDDNCDGTTDEGCAPMTGGDVCADAIPIVLNGGRATIRGSLAGYASDYRSECSTTGSPDVVYALNLTGASDVRIDTSGSATDTVVAVALDCTTVNPWGIGCDGDIAPAFDRAARVWLHDWGRSPGERRVFILVEGQTGADRGSYQLNVEVGPAAAPSCAAPLDISGGGSVVGAIDPSFAAGPEGRCQSGGEMDETEHVLALTVPSDGVFTLDVVSRDFTPDVYVRAPTCAPDDEVECMRGFDSGLGVRVASVTAAIPSGGQAYVFVDGAQAGTGGHYYLSYTP